MKKIPLLIFFTSISFSLFSQQLKVTRDFGIWGGFNIEKELPLGFKINLENQLRTYTNSSEIDDYLIDLGSKYTINKNFKLGANLRYTYNARRWNDNEHNYRYNLDLHYRAKLSPKLKLYYRVRYQRKFVNYFHLPQPSNIHFSKVRNKVKLRYTLNEKHRLYTSGELFKSTETYKEPVFDKLRFHIGDDIKTNKGNLNCSIGYEQEINSENPLSFLFLRTHYTLKL
ncbi:MAG: DUF2490 domain-containing protein [Bacteroidia bacterium]